MEESQEQKPNKTEEKRNPDGTFAEGTKPGPGRPKGQTLKEYWKERFKLMTDEEKEAFSFKVGNEAIWKMAEGLPKADVGLEVKLTMADVLKEIENGNQIIGQTVALAEPLQDSGQEEKPNDVPEKQSPAALQPEQVVEKYNPEV